MDGFYVPDSVSSSYVANKRTNEGSLMYEGLANQVGLQKQAAVQQLEKNYATTVENAYTSYLAANRGVMGSQMGQGYKELYKQLQNAQLQQNIAQATLDLSEQRQTLETQEASALSEIEQQYNQEVTYFDRVQQSFADYLSYAKDLYKIDAKTGGATDETYLDVSELSQSVDSMYNILHSIKPENYVDADGNIGMTYEEWVKSQLTNSEEDTAYRQWLFSTGLNEFLAAPKSVKQWEVGELKERRLLQEELEAYEKGGELTDRIKKYLESLPEDIRKQFYETHDIGFIENRDLSAGELEWWVGKGQWAS